MKHISPLFALALLVASLFGCSNINEDLQKRMSQLPNGELFTFMNETMPKKEYEAMQFLYAYMPLGDLTDYPSEFYRKNIQASLKAREEMPWGKDIPDTEFNHFVLPIRINNENLDESRMVFYEELKGRVGGMTARDAVLEVNHWCHEKVNYRGSDIRTSSPLATVRTSWGRCGEESTFLVAALRAVCIPARQVYTPRWAHCDDNHAWVEAYVDGKWHFLGACEPEPVLDLGWFNAPASRALLVHTRVFGRYNGPEEVIERTANHTEINVIDTYTNSARLDVAVVDESDNPVADAKVDFKIYNYSEFNTVASKTTDNQGNTFMTAGRGSMMVYASKNGKFGYGLVNFGQDNFVKISLDKTVGETYTIEYDIVPPRENAFLPEVTAEMRAENDRRFNEEDNIRNAYIASCAKHYNDVEDPEEFLPKSWGNYQTIIDFIKYSRNKGKEGLASTLLKELTDKDLRDVAFDVLVDNLDNAVVCDSEMFAPYVLNPRVANEMIRPYKKALGEYFSDAAEKIRSNPEALVDWVNENIAIHDEMNVRHIPMLPTGVLRAKAADSYSRGIFFVAALRSVGVPSRIDPITGKVQYYKDEKWNDVVFEKSASNAVSSETGTLHLTLLDSQSDKDPRYYTDFSIKKFNGNTFDLLAYDEKDPGMDVGALYSTTFKDGIQLDAGYYVLICGTRLDDGSVLSRLVFFNVEAGKDVSVALIFRNNNNNQNIDKSKLRIVGLLDGGSEPTTHVMQEISILKEKYSQFKGSILFIFKDEESKAAFEKKHFDLPKNIVTRVATKKDSAFVAEFSSLTMPVFVVEDTKGNRIMTSNGYTIGLAERMIK